MPAQTFRCIKYEPPAKPLGTIFFIASFRTKIWHYKMVVRQLVECGFQVYAYDYDWRPLQNASYPHEWLEFSERIKDDISTKIVDEKDQDHKHRFGIIGVSIGATIALHAAKLLPDIERVMLVTVYGSMAQHIWEHPVLENMRDRCASLEMNIHQAAKILGYYEPTYKLGLMRNRKILLFANKQDPVIPYTNTEILINDANNRGVSLITKYIEANRHSLTILKVFQRPGMWISFFTALKHSSSTYYYDTKASSIHALQTPRLAHHDTR